MSTYPLIESHSGTAGRAMHDEDQTDLAASGLEAPAGLTADPSRRHRRVWLAVAALLAFTGVGGSVYAFGSVRGASERSHKALVSSSVEVAAALRLAIQHEQDLIVSTESFIIGNPTRRSRNSPSGPPTWGSSHRYPELLGLVVVQYVPAAQLAAYAERASTDSSAPFTVFPAGKEPFYCFAPVGVERSGGAAIPTNYNLCAGTLGQKVQAARAQGTSAVLPSDGRNCWLSMSPSTAPARSPRPSLLAIGPLSN